MRTCLLFLLFVAFVSMPAYAHRRHHHYHHHHSHEHFTAIDRRHDDYAREKSNAPPELESREPEQESRVPERPSPNGEPSLADENTTGGWLPPGWQQQQPADPKWQGKRFASPDGTGSFSAYITPVAQEPIA